MDKDRLISTVQAAQTGDNNAINLLFNEYYNDIYNIAYRETKNHTLACDITQEACIEIINTIGKLREPAAFVSWAKRITYHQCTRYYRKKEVVHEFVIDEPIDDEPTIFDTLEEENVEFIPDAALEQEEFKQTILNFIDLLPAEQRAAILMFYVDEMSIKEIAEIQGVSEGTVSSRLNYGKKAIKRAVEEYEEKNDIKLHAIPFFPFFKWLLDGKEKSMSIEAAKTAADAIHKATGRAVSVSKGVSSAASVTKAVGLSTKIASSSVTAKIIAGVVVVAVAISSIIPIVNRTPKPNDSKTEQNITENTGDLDVDSEFNIINQLPNETLTALNEFLSYFSQSQLSKFPTTDEELYNFAYVYNRIITENFTFGNNFSSYCVKKEDIDAVIEHYFKAKISEISNENTSLIDNIYYNSVNYDEIISPQVSIAREVYWEETNVCRIVFDIFEDNMSRDLGMWIPSYYYSFNTAHAYMNTSLLWLTGGEMKVLYENGSITVLEYKLSEDIKKDNSTDYNEYYIPNNCTYYIANQDKILHSGEKFPTPHTGDIYKDNSYEYHYNEFLTTIESSEFMFEENWESWQSDEYQYGWSVRVLDDKLEHYSDMISIIAGRPVINLNYTFAMCEKLKDAPSISTIAQKMNYTFYGCGNMKSAKIIIPESVDTMEATFMFCSNLTGYIAINATPHYYTNCFWRTAGQITLCGLCDKEIAKDLASQGNNINLASDIGIYLINNLDYYLSQK